MNKFICLFVTNFLILNAIILNPMERPGQEIYDRACIVVANNTLETLKKLLKTDLRFESVEKNALRFAYAKKCNQDIDPVKCVEFLQNCTNFWINTKEIPAMQREEMYTHTLLTEKHLKNIIPLLEPVLEQPIITLHLNVLKIQSLPENLYLLKELSYLDLYNPILTKDRRFESFIDHNHLHALPAWLAQMPSLKKLIIDPQLSITADLAKANIEIWKYTHEGKIEKFLSKFTKST